MMLNSTSEFMESYSFTHNRYFITSWKVEEEKNRLGREEQRWEREVKRSSGRRWLISQKRGGKDERLRFRAGICKTNDFLEDYKPIFCLWKWKNKRKNSAFVQLFRGERKEVVKTLGIRISKLGSLDAICVGGGLLGEAPEWWEQGVTGLLLSKSCLFECVCTYIYMSVYIKSRKSYLKTRF